MNCVSMPEYGLDCQSRRSKSCVVNDGSLSTEVLRVAIGTGTEVREVNCPVRLRSKRKWPENRADGQGEGRGAQITVPTSPSSVITAAQNYPSGFASQQVKGP